MEARHLLATSVACLLASACAHKDLSSSAATPQAPAEVLRPEETTSRLISRADALLASGRSELGSGHVERAREAFDAAVSLYLTSPGGAYADARRSEAFRRTLESVHIQEIESAAEAFREDTLEPASIDTVADLAVSDLPTTKAALAQATLSAHAAGDFPVELNDAVLACVSLYSGRLRDWYEAALSRGQRHLPHIRQVFAEEGLPTELAYVALVESAFRPTAYSRAKARGVWQFISSTGRRYGLQQDWWVDERSDTEKATRAAARYLKELYAMFGDWNLALAGYNGGEGRVLRALDRTSSTTFWEIAKTRMIHRETRNYVPLIHAAILIARSPQEYGITVTPEPPLSFEIAPVAGARDLRRVAECIDAPVETLRELNPELRRMATPAGRTFGLRVPPGTTEALTSCLASLPPEQHVAFRTHRVKRGQTLAGIARRNRVAVRDLAEANGISPGRPLAIGTELLIPSAARPARAAVRSASAKKRSPEGPDRIRYRIRSGDTLTAIASQHGVSVQDLRTWNGLRGSRIAAGQTLTIFSRRTF